MFYSRRLGLAAFILHLFLPGWAAQAQEAGIPGRITYAYSDWKPIIYNDNGRATGMYAEILSEIFEKELKLSLNYMDRPWKRAQFEVASGTADMMITVPTRTRNTYALISDKPVFRLYMALYTYKDHPRLAEIENIRSIGDIRELGLTAVTNLGNGWHRENVEKAGIKTLIVPRDRNIARMLAHKRADIMIDTAVSMNHIIRRDGFTGQLVKTDVTFGPINMHIMISRKSPFRNKMADIQAAQERISADGRLSAITTRYTQLTK